VDTGEYLVVVDCGVGCHYRLSDRGLLTEVDYVFITHSHMDHFLGLPEALFQAHIEGRTRPLYIYAPRVVEEATRLVATHLFKSPRYEMVFRRVSPGVLLDLPGLRVEAASAEAVLQHGCAILEKRRHLIVASVGALTKLPRCGAGLVFAISGAIGGLDFVAETAARCTTSCINTAPRKKTGGGTALLADAAPAELRRRHQAGGGEAGGRRGEGRRAGGPHRP